MKLLFFSLLVLFLMFFCLTKIDHFETGMLLETRVTEESGAFQFEGINEIIRNPLHYIGNGEEAIAFVTSDGKYVLKFFLKKAIFKKRFFKPKKRIKQLLFRDNIINTGYETLKKYEEAMELLAEETGLLGVHARKENKRFPICTLIDYRGKEHKVDLNKVAFVLQRKAKIISRRMSAEECKKVTEELYELFSRISQKGFVNLSPTFNPANFATIDNHGVMIDLGKLEYVPSDAHDLGEASLQRRYASWLARKVDLQN